MKLETTQARQEFAETLNHVAYGKKRVVLQRRGKDIAAIVSIPDLQLLESCEQQPPAPGPAATAPAKAARAAKRQRRVGSAKVRKAA